MKPNETNIAKYLQKNWKIIFPKFHLIQINPTIYGVYSNKRIGMADFLFRFHKLKTRYIVELKYRNCKSEDLWDSIKAIAYAKAYALKTGFTTKPVVIIKKEIITNDIRTIFYELKLNYITIELTREGFFFEYDFE